MTSFSVVIAVYNGERFLPDAMAAGLRTLRRLYVQSAECRSRIDGLQRPEAVLQYLT